MPAYFESGFFVRKPAWHGMGVVVDVYPGTWAEARKLAGLMWEPVEAPAIGFAGKDKRGRRVLDPAAADLVGATLSIDEDGNILATKDGKVVGSYENIEGRKRIVRSDTGATLGVPGEDYAIISHDEIGSIIEAVNLTPNARYETTVVLEGGKAIAAVILLDEPITLPGDKSPTLPYLALTARHDGTGSCRAQATSVRVVCANTFAAAEMEADRNGTVFVFRHTKNWRDHVKEAQEAIRGVRQAFEVYVEAASVLAKAPVTKEQTHDFLAQFIPAPLESVAASKVVMRHIEEARLTVQAILDSDTCEGIRGTGFGLVQAAGEYLDHYRGYRNADTYMGRQLLRPEKRKQEAVKIVRELVGV